MEEDYGIDAGASGQGRRESRLIIALQDISRICMDMPRSGYVKGLIQGQAASGEGRAGTGTEHGGVPRLVKLNARHVRRILAAFS
jgi:hypothetical protein